jgi:hypothetical protein
MQIDLSSEELGFLAELLRRDYQELREEVYKTEDSRFKADLRTRQNVSAGAKIDRITPRPRRDAAEEK